MLCNIFPSLETGPKFHEEMHNCDHSKTISSAQIPFQNSG